MALKHWNYWKRRALELMLIDVEGWSIITARRSSSLSSLLSTSCGREDVVSPTRTSSPNKAEHGEESALSLNDGQSCTNLMHLTQSSTKSGICWNSPKSLISEMTWAVNSVPLSFWRYYRSTRKEKDIHELCCNFCRTFAFHWSQNTELYEMVLVQFTLICL